MEQNNNWSWGVGGIVLRGNEILLVRHTYGAAKNQLLIPGGFVQNGEMPEMAAVREVFEETGVTVAAKELLGIRFQIKNWYAVFLMEYISGDPRTDENENDLAGFVDLEEALKRDDLTNLTRLMIQAAMNGFAGIPLNPYFSGEKRDEYMLYGLGGNQNENH